MYSVHDIRQRRMGFPIRISSDQSVLGSSPRRIVPCNVLLRHLVSRHPPCALVEIAHYRNTQQCFRRCVTYPINRLLSIVKVLSAAFGTVILNKVKNPFLVISNSSLRSQCCIPSFDGIVNWHKIYFAFGSYILVVNKKAAVQAAPNQTRSEF